MPPSTANADSAEGKKITVLCELIMSCEGFKADTAKMAQILGISHAKNVPRTINSIVSPYGFELRGGKVIKKDVAPVSATAATNGSSDDTAKASGSAKVSGSAKKAAAAKSRKALPTARVNKKRKVSETAEEEDGADNEAS